MASNLWTERVLGGRMTVRPVRRRGYDVASMADRHVPDVVERLLARDEEALREVMAAYGGVVFGMARRILREAALAEEVAQDTFLALWRRPGAFDSDRG